MVYSFYFILTLNVWLFWKKEKKDADSNELEHILGELLENFQNEEKDLKEKNVDEWQQNNDLPAHSDEPEEHNSNYYWENDE